LPADIGQFNRPMAESPQAYSAPPSAPRPAQVTSNRAIVPSAPSPAPPVQSRARTRSNKMIAAVLPKTGSYLPLLAALGLLGIVAGLLLRILAMRLERR